LIQTIGKYFDSFAKIMILCLSLEM